MRPGADNVYGAGELILPAPRAGSHPLLASSVNASCDGSISPVDAQFILQFDAGIIGHINCQSAADTNQDGDIGPIDASLILQFVVGIIHSLPP